jgi:serine phosphatase RsbU (regulator of sigma subunit)
MYSDGYQDQFGGDLGKKFMKKRFLELIHKIADLPIEEQQQQLELTLNDWMGDEKQVDDILVMGVKL